MTPPPISQLPDGFSTRTRVKWDNIAIVLIGLVVACFAVVGILASGGGTASSVTGKPSAEQPLAAEPAEEALEVEGALTAQDAQSLVDEARAFMTEARWDEAADRLATVPAEFRSTLGVEALEQELAATRAKHGRLTAELEASVQARQWKQAKVLLGELARIAVLDAQLLETQAIVEAALAPKPKPEPKPKPKPAKADAVAVTRPAAVATGGGSAAASSGSTTRPRPAPATSRPANSSTSGGGTRPAAPSATSGSGTGAGTGTPASGPASAAPGGSSGDVHLTPDQQAEFEAALAAALA